MREAVQAIHKFIYQSIAKLQHNTCEKELKEAHISPSVQDNKADQVTPYQAHIIHNQFNQRICQL